MGYSRMRTAAIGTLAVASLAGAIGDTSAFAASGAKTTGKVSALITSQGGKTYDVWQGAITDYGTDRAAAHGMQKIVLRQGSFLVDAAKFDKSIKFKSDPKTCGYSGAGSASAAAISGGTGAYAGISGSLKIKGTFSGIAAKKAGKCAFQAPKGLADSYVIQVTGKVSY